MPGHAVWTANSSLAFTAILPVLREIDLLREQLSTDPTPGGDKSNNRFVGANLAAAGAGRQDFRHNCLRKPWMQSRLRLLEG